MSVSPRNHVLRPYPSKVRASRHGAPQRESGLFEVMRVGPHEGISTLVKRQREPRSPHPCQARAARGQPSTSLGRDLLMTRLALWPWASSLQKCEKMSFHCLNCLVCGILLGPPKLTKMNTNQNILGVENTHFGTDVLSVKTGLCLTNCLLLGGNCNALGGSPVEKVSGWEAEFLSGTACLTWAFVARKRRRKTTTLAMLVPKPASPSLGSGAHTTGVFFNVKTK